MAAGGKGPGPSSLLGLPAFLFAVFVFYWSLPIFAITYRIRFAKLRGPRNDVLDWAKCVARFFGITVLRYGEQTLYKGGRCLYLSNHRSWADFFIDPYLTEGRAALMSRWLVYFVFPMFCTSVMVLKGIVLFKRTTIQDKEAFNAWLDNKLETSFIPGFLVYPEGHRSLKPTSLPLKRGMLHYAFSRKLPVQIIMTRGKEDVMSEKTLSIRFGKALVTSYSQVIKPSDCADFEAFATEVQKTWDALWSAVYSADAKALRPWSVETPQAFDYPQKVRLQQLLTTIASIFIFGVVLYGSWRGLAAALALAGSAQQVVVGVLAAWTGAAMLKSAL